MNVGEKQKEKKPKDIEVLHLSIQGSRLMKKDLVKSTIANCQDQGQTHKIRTKTRER